MKASKFFTASMLLALALGFVPSSNAQIFSQSIRRDGQPGEGDGIAALRLPTQNGGLLRCTAFFVRNKNNRPLLMTARHCAIYQLDDVCNAGILKIITHAGSQTGKCARVVVENKELDEAMIEADFDNWSSLVPTIDFYDLSSQKPRMGTRVVALGFPYDSGRRGAFTVSSQCWINGNPMVTINDYPKQQEQMTADSHIAWAGQRLRIDKEKGIAIVEMTTEVQSALAFLQHRQAAYENCSVYGGNSGGPIMIEGTHTVLGMPTSYFSDGKTRQPPSLSGSMDATADFVARNRSQLRKLGVSMVEPYPADGYVPPYQYALDPYYRVKRCFRSNDLTVPSPQAVADMWCQQE